MHFEKLIYEEIDSTNTEAARLVSSGSIAKPTMVFAHKQTAGRGTRGRDWQSQRGNVQVSYVFEVTTDVRHLPKMVYPIALCVRDVLASYLPEAKVQIKWPNDILVDGSKVSGSLHETASFGGKLFFIAGIGVNVLWKPQSQVLYEPTSLAEHIAAPPAAVDVAEALAQTISSRVLTWKSSDFPNDKKMFLSHCFGLGGEVSISLTKERSDKHTGKFVGITDDGAIEVQTENELLNFTSGDIFPSLKSSS